MSVAITVYNDRHEFGPTLEALARQTRPAGEIVIVDAGSTDGTLDLIASWQQKGLPIRLVSAPGVNISAGRNIAIEKSSYDLVACTDAGCRPDPDWVEVLASALEEAQFVAGIWRVAGETDFEKCIGLALHPSADDPRGGNVLARLVNRFLGRFYSVERATGRSMAFDKAAWRAVGGFPEHLYAGEDVRFSAAMVAHVERAVLEPRAVVAWRPHRTWGATARTYFRYARGAIRSQPGVHQLIRASALLVMIGVAVVLVVATPRWEVCVLLAALALLPGLIVPLGRARRSDVPFRSYVWRIPLVVVTKDVANIAGAAVGAVDGLLGRTQPSPTRAPEPAPREARTDPPAA